MSFRNFAGIIAAFVVTAQGAYAQEEADLAKQLGERMQQAWRSRQQLPGESRASGAAVLDEIVASLSEKELILVGRYLPEQGFNQAVFKRWGSLDPAAALAAARQVEDRNAASIALAGTGTAAGETGETVSYFVNELLLGAMEGWAEKEPKAAWSAFRDRKGPFAHSSVIDDYSTTYYKLALKKLARIDAEFAFSEMLSLRDDELIFVAMLGGYLDGAPDKQDWEKQVNAILERKWNRGWVYREIRFALLGRWLNDDPDAASKWFEKGDVENLHWSTGPTGPVYGDESQKHEVKKRVRHNLDPAIGYWAARDFPGAFRWMKSHQRLDIPGFETSALAGAERFFGSVGEARGYFLRQSAKLPSQEDRGRFALGFAKVLWRFEDGSDLGKPFQDEDAWLKAVDVALTELNLDNESKRRIVEKLD